MSTDRTAHLELWQPSTLAELKRALRVGGSVIVGLGQYCGQPVTWQPRWLHDRHPWLLISMVGKPCPHDPPHVPEPGKRPMCDRYWRFRTGHCMPVWPATEGEKR